MKLGGGDRLDLASQAAQRQAMNARQNAPMAEFVLLPTRIFRGGSGLPLRAAPARFRYRVTGSDRRSARPPRSRGRWNPSSREDSRRRRRDALDPALGRDPTCAIDSLRPARSRPVDHTNACHSSTGGRMISVSSASCSSSASRTTGQDSSATCAIAAGSSAPMLLASSGDKSPAKLHGACAAFFERRVVEIRVRIRVQNFVAERRGSGVSIATVRSVPVGHALQDSDQAVDVHRFMQAVRDGLVDQRMIGNANFARQIFGARDLIGKHAASRSSARMRWIGGGTLCATLRTAARPARATRSISSARRTSAHRAAPASAHAPPVRLQKTEDRFPAGRNADRSARAPGRYRSRRLAVRN